MAIEEAESWTPVEWVVNSVKVSFSGLVLFAVSMCVVPVVSFSDSGTKMVVSDSH